MNVSRCVTVLHDSRVSAGEIAICQTYFSSVLCACVNGWCCVCMRVDFFLFSRLILTFTMFGHKRVFVILCVKIFSQIVRHAMVFVVCVRVCFGSLSLSDSWCSVISSYQNVHLYVLTILLSGSYCCYCCNGGHR